MGVSSSRLNQKDFNYFENNFKIKNTNVSSLEEAEIILFGEDHLCLEHRIKICWLLNKLACEKDSIYIEGCDPQTVLSKDDFAYNYQYPVYPQVKITGWDYIPSFTKISEFFDKTTSLTEWLENIISKNEAGLISPQDKIDAIYKMSAFFSRDEVQALLDRMKKNDFSFDFEDGDLVLNLPLFIDALISYASLAKNANGKALDALFFLSAKKMTQISQLLSTAALSGELFLDRNISYAEQVSDFSGQGVFYGISGKKHVSHKNKKGILAEKKSVEVLNNALKERKYVILFPTKGRVNIEYPKKIFEKTNLKKIMDFSRLVLSESLDYKRIPSWLTVGTAMACAATTAFFPYISSVVVLANLGLITTETYFNSEPVKEFCTDIEENCNEIDNLDKLINHKIRSLPKILNQTIISQFPEV